MESKGRIACGCGGDSERRRPFIADVGTGGEKAQEVVEKAREDAREGGWWRQVEEAQHRRDVSPAPP
jgi:hypothetical protein